MTKKSLPRLVQLTALGIVSIISILIIGTTQIYSQTLETQSKSQVSTIHISKDASNSYTLSTGSSHIGTFDTSYTILGNPNSLKASQDLITSTIITDFNKSPVVGYVIANKGKSDSKLPTLANPFVDKSTIDTKIKNEIQNSISYAQKLKTTQSEIKCIFGMAIKDWKCSTHGLLG